MVLAHVLDDRQSQACAARGARARGVRPVEALEDAVQVVGRNPDALVLDVDLHHAAVGARGDSHPGVIRRIRDRVAHEIAQGREDLLAVADHLGSGCADDDEFDAASVSEGAHLVDGLDDHRVDLEDSGAGERIVALQARQLDDVVDERGEA